MDKKIRTCILSKKKAKQEDLIQICFMPCWKISINEKWKSFIKWRSVYLTNSKKTIEKFLQKWIKFLNNFLKKEVSEDDYNKLKVLIKNFCKNK